MNGRARILVVEDDDALASMTADYLRQHDFQVEIERRGDRAVERVLREAPDLVMLDLSLPGLDGLAVCRKIRPSYAGPILMLTARGEHSDEILGLDMGADDYMAKPVRPRVLLARVHALLRRQPAAAAEGAVSRRIDVGELVVDEASRQASFGGKPLELTSGEFDLLALLAARAGEVVDRASIYQRLLGADYDRLDRSMDLRVSHLRQKLSDAGAGPDVIRTVRGAGYLYARA